MNLRQVAPLDCGFSAQSVMAESHHIAHYEYEVSGWPGTYVKNRIYAKNGNLVYFQQSSVDLLPLTPLSPTIFRVKLPQAVSLKVGVAVSVKSLPFPLTVRLYLPVSELLVPPYSSVTDLA